MSDVVARAKAALEDSAWCWTGPQTPEIVRGLVAEVEKLQRAAKTLGKIIDDTLADVLKATDSHDLIGEDGDGDWMLVFERLHSQASEVERLRAIIAGLEAQR